VFCRDTVKMSVVIPVECYNAEDHPQQANNSADAFVDYVDYVVSISESTTAAELIRNVIMLRRFHQPSKHDSTINVDHLVANCMVCVVDLSSTKVAKPSAPKSATKLAAKSTPVGSSSSTTSANSNNSTNSAGSVVSKPPTMIYLMADALLYPYRDTRQYKFRILGLSLNDSQMNELAHQLQQREIAALASKITMLTSTLTQLCSSSTSTSSASNNGNSNSQLVPSRRHRNDANSSVLNGETTAAESELSNAIQLRYSQFIHEVNEMLTLKEQSCQSIEEKQRYQGARRSLLSGHVDDLIAETALLTTPLLTGVPHNIAGIGSPNLHRSPVRAAGSFAANSSSGNMMLLEAPSTVTSTSKPIDASNRKYNLRTATAPNADTAATSSHNHNMDASLSPQPRLRGNSASKSFTHNANAANDTNTADINTLSSNSQNNLSSVTKLTGNSCLLDGEDDSDTTYPQLSQKSDRYMSSDSDDNNNNNKRSQQQQTISSGNTKKSRESLLPSPSRHDRSSYSATAVDTQASTDSITTVNNQALQASVSKKRRLSSSTDDNTAAAVAHSSDVDEAIKNNYNSNNERKRRASSLSQHSLQPSSVSSVIGVGNVGAAVSMSSFANSQDSACSSASDASSVIIPITPVLACPITSPNTRSKANASASGNAKLQTPPAHTQSPPKSTAKKQVPQAPVENVKKAADENAMIVEEEETQIPADHLPVATMSIPSEPSVTSAVGLVTATEKVPEKEETKDGKEAGSSDSSDSDSESDSSDSSSSSGSSDSSDSSDSDSSDSESDSDSDEEAEDDEKAKEANNKATAAVEAALAPVDVPVLPVDAVKTTTEEPVSADKKDASDSDSDSDSGSSDSGSDSNSSSSSSGSGSDSDSDSDSDSSDSGSHSDDEAEPEDDKKNKKMDVDDDTEGSEKPVVITQPAPVTQFYDDSVPMVLTGDVTTEELAKKLAGSDSSDSNDSSSSDSCDSSDDSSDSSDDSNVGGSDVDSAVTDNHNKGRNKQRVATRSPIVRPPVPKPAVPNALAVCALRAIYVFASMLFVFYRDC
jgi:hypothetical protein